MSNRSIAEDLLRRKSTVMKYMDRGNDSGALAVVDELIERTSVAEQRVKELEAALAESEERTKMAVETVALLRQRLGERVH